MSNPPVLELLRARNDERTRLLAASSAGLSGDDRFLGMWLVGSLASGAADAMSDIDMYVVVADDAIASLIGDPRSVLERFGAIVNLTTPPNLWPMGGIYLAVKFAGTGWHQTVDCMWQPLSKAQVPSDARIVFEKVEVPQTDATYYELSTRWMSDNALRDAVEYFWSVVTWLAGPVIRRHTDGVAFLHQRIEDVRSALGLPPAQASSYLELVDDMEALMPHVAARIGAPDPYPIESARAMARCVRGMIDAGESPPRWPLESKTLEAEFPLTGVRIGTTTHSHATRSVTAFDCDQGSFVAKLDIAAPQDTRVLEYLQGKGFRHAPAVVPPLAGESNICVLERIPRLLADEEHATDDTWHKLGQATAGLNAFTDCAATYYIDIAGAIDELRVRSRGLPFESEYVALLETLRPLQDVPASGLIHGEMHPWNLGLRDDGTIVALDWDGTGHGPTVLEYGYPLIMVFLSKDDLVFHASSASAYYRGYIDEGAVIDHSLVFEAALYHAMRYMFPPRQGLHEIELRWRRIQHAVAHRGELQPA